uniref:Uncharacterized protein n=1 Tax=Oryza meridionalis TaxID=40149 RepID=A0A0E0E252_9ORYZ
MASLRATTLLVLMQIIMAFYTVMLSCSFSDARTFPGGEGGYPVCVGRACPTPGLPYNPPGPCIYRNRCNPPGRMGDP